MELLPEYLNIDNWSKLFSSRKTLRSCKKNLNTVHLYDIHYATRDIERFTAYKKICAYHYVLDQSCIITPKLIKETYLKIFSVACIETRQNYIQSYLHILHYLSYLLPCPFLNYSKFCNIFLSLLRLGCPHVFWKNPCQALKLICRCVNQTVSYHHPCMAVSFEQLDPFWCQDYLDSMGVTRFGNSILWLSVIYNILKLYNSRVNYFLYTTTTHMAFEVPYSKVKKCQRRRALTFSKARVYQKNRYKIFRFTAELNEYFIGLASLYQKFTYIKLRPCQKPKCTVDKFQSHNCVFELILCLVCILSHLKSVYSYMYILQSRNWDSLLLSMPKVNISHVNKFSKLYNSINYISKSTNVFKRRSNGRKSMMSVNLDYCPSMHQTSMHNNLYISLYTEIILSGILHYVYDTPCILRKILIQLYSIYKYNKDLSVINTKLINYHNPVISKNSIYSLTAFNSTRPLHQSYNESQNNDFYYINNEQEELQEEFATRLKIYMKDIYDVHHPPVYIKVSLIVNSNITYPNFLFEFTLNRSIKSQLPFSNSNKENIPVSRKDKASETTNSFHNKYISRFISMWPTITFSVFKDVEYVLVVYTDIMSSLTISCLKIPINASYILMTNSFKCEIYSIDYRVNQRTKLVATSDNLIYWIKGHPQFIYVCSEKLCTYLKLADLSNILCISSIKIEMIQYRPDSQNSLIQQKCVYRKRKPIEKLIFNKPSKC